MKVISMIPSWTETLIEAGVNVVGRTRFCIHPEGSVRHIPVVGGTKDINWEKIKDLNPDILLLDKEENLKAMADVSPYRLLISHVNSLRVMPDELEAFAQIFNQQAQALRDFKKRYEVIISKPRPKWKTLPMLIPGEIDCLRRDFESYESIVYVIWRDPWMRVGRQTFIGSVLDHLGAEKFLPKGTEKYPKFDLQDWDLEKTYFLFSSEPYPFEKKKEELRALNVQGSIVDGESFSWFGIRNLRFMESFR